MTLRARLTALTTSLLAVVLAAAGGLLAAAGAQDVTRSLEARARDLARAAVPGAAGRRDPTAALAPADDGASLVRFVLDVARPGDPVEPTIVTSRRSGSVPVPDAEARRRAALDGPDDVEHVAFGGTTWVVATELGAGREGGLRRGPPWLRARPGDDGPPPREPDDELDPRPPSVAGDDRPLPPPRGPGRLLTVAFVESAPALAAHRAFALRLAGIGALALGVGALLAWALAGRMLRPVAAAARAAEAIERPTERLPAPASRDELARLVGVLNGMLGRLEAASARERLFLATASHELRRPLTSLLGELELAAAPGRDAASLRASVLAAQEDAGGMRRLVEDLLHHAKAEAGTVRLVESETALDRLVSQAVERSRRALGRPVEVATSGVGADVLRIDADLLRRALENLVVNAAVHAGDGAQVAVRSDVECDGLSIHVDDDGPGVPPEELATIFEPFGRGDRARTAPGFGLGLAIARDVARAHGGELSVTSPRPGASAGRPGARFTLRLPAARIVRT